LEEAAHLKRVVGVSFGRNGTDVLFKWAADNFVLMGSSLADVAERYVMHESCRVSEIGLVQSIVVRHGRT
jgi:hypothetical protein